MGCREWRRQKERQRHLRGTAFRGTVESNGTRTVIKKREWSETTRSCVRKEANFPVGRIGANADGKLSESKGRGRRLQCGLLFKVCGAPGWVVSGWVRPDPPSHGSRVPVVFSPYVPSGRSTSSTPSVSASDPSPAPAFLTPRCLLVSAGLVAFALL